MSTRSRIGYVTPEGWVVSSYCHWDGYPSNNGEILKKYYKTKRKVSRLVWLGSLSSLHRHVSTKKQHSYDSPAEGITVAYVRDRKENPEWCEPRVDANVEKFVKSDVEEWGYLFKDKKWYVVDGHNGQESRKLVPLTDKIIEANEIPVEEDKQ